MRTDAWGDLWKWLGERGLGRKDFWGEGGILRELVRTNVWERLEIKGNGEIFWGDPPVCMGVGNHTKV